MVRLSVLSSADLFRVLRGCAVVHALPGPPSTTITWWAMRVLPPSEAAVTGYSFEFYQCYMMDDEDPDLYKLVERLVRRLLLKRPSSTDPGNVWLFWEIPNDVRETIEAGNHVTGYSGKDGFDNRAGR